MKKNSLQLVSSTFNQSHPFKKMLILHGQTGTYHLELRNAKPGKFGGVMTGVRLEDHLSVSGKLIPFPDQAEEQERVRRILNLNHPNLARTIEVIAFEDKHYLVREYYEGDSLKTILSKGKYHKHLPADFYLKATCSLLQGLEVMHQHGIVHRDIKPSNIIVRHGAKSHPSTWNPADVLLTDFEQSIQFPTLSRNRSPFALVYSPPEQLLNHTWLASPEGDLFSLSVTLYEMLMGSAPWVDCNAEILLNLQLTYPMKKPATMREPLFNILAKAAYKEPFPLPPKRLSGDVIETILQKGISRRYQSAMAMHDDLLNYLTQYPTPLRKSFWRFWGKCQ